MRAKKQANKRTLKKTKKRRNNENNNNNEKEKNGGESNPFVNNVPKIEMAGAVDPGDTNDETHFEARCKIYKLKNGEYKEKGIGDIKVNSVKHYKTDENMNENETQTDKTEKEKTKEAENGSEKEKEKEKETVIDSARLICRREKIGKLILNEFIQKDTKFEIENQKFLRVSFVSPRALNNSDDEEEEEETNNASNDKTKDKESGASDKNESEFIVNTYLIRVCFDCLLFFVLFWVFCSIVVFVFFVF